MATEGVNGITGILNVAGAHVSADLKDFIKQKSLTKFGSVQASGRLADSVRFDINDSVLRVYALEYIYQIEHGRKPGKYPPYDKNSTKYGSRKRGKNKGKPRGDFPNISDWIENKPAAQARFGWSALTEAAKSSLVYLLARKIAQEGTTIYKQGGSKLLQDIVNDDFRGALKSQLILTFRTKINAQMRSAIVGK